MVTNTVEPHASDVISEAWFYVATHFLTEIWDRRCWHQKTGIFFLIFSQKMGINILGGPLRKSIPAFVLIHALDTMLHCIYKISTHTISQNFVTLSVHCKDIHATVTKCQHYHAAPPHSMPVLMNIFDLLLCQMT